MRIATWNVNSVRARLVNVTSWLEAARPDVLLLQEIKCETDAFPRFEFEAMGYQCHVIGQKSYNGVALLTQLPATEVITALPDDEADTQARYIEATIEGMRIASLYLPNGNPVGTEKYDYKLAWMKRLKAHCAAMLRSETPFVLGGDFNVIPEAIDVYDPKGWEQDALFQPRTRAAYREILNLGITEAFRTLHPTEQAYTFWDYQAGAWQRDLGLRIDHFFLSPEAADRLIACDIDREPRSHDKASDHTPVVVTVR
ncbi:MAG TPA: exodeoxyribonuclease III [Rhodospirillaceae bacterium]|nr:exodeoxyribonuclease III [Rhodospirillaceae bacterium]